MILWLNRERAPSAMTPNIGSWLPITSDGKKTALAACPRCAFPQSLADHDIDPTGAVTPSAQCDCGFHEMIGLEDWLL